MNDRLLDAGEVAQLLAVPVTWVRQETRAGRMPCLELGRYRRYDRDAVVGWLETCRAGQWRKHLPKKQNGDSFREAAPDPAAVRISLPDSECHLLKR